MSEQPQLAGMPAPRPHLSERELQGCVIDAAHIFGWRVAHFRPAMTKHGWRTAVGADGAGFPDLVLVRDEILFVELKVRRNTLSAEQAEWIVALRAAGVDAHVWTDSDWLDGTIEARLRRADRSADSAVRTANTDAA
jgi:hypothetical protein